MRKTHPLVFVSAAALAVAALTGMAYASDGEVLPASNASVMVCSGPIHLNTPGGHASYTECRSGGYVQVRGYVEDTDADGECAQVYANYSSGLETDYSPRACPKGDRKDFVFPSRQADDAYVYLREVPASG
jgi:hypothetical protein